jgi:hypothetical protein
VADPGKPFGRAVPDTLKVMLERRRPLLRIHPAFIALTARLAALTAQPPLATMPAFPVLD